MSPKYPPVPPAFLASMIWDMVCGTRRSFKEDSSVLTASLSINISGIGNIPQTGPALLLMNHYHRPGFQAFWFGMAISAVVPMEVHWAITAAWTDDGTKGAALKAWLSPFFLPRLANMYEFTSMPPMPPRPHEVEARARAVLHLINTARQNPLAVLAFAPEGQDNPSGGLMRPPAGVGRLLSQFNRMGYRLIPIGVYEDDLSLVLKFGEPFTIIHIKDMDPHRRDQVVTDQAMNAIANQLPPELRGVYS